MKSLVSDKFYIGSSEHPHTRLNYHNNFEKGFTSRYRPWGIVYLKEFSNKAEAQAAERKVKSWKSKLMVQRLIKREIKL